MKRGRPVRSQIRQNIVEILKFMGEGYGYEIHKIYKEIFDPSPTLRVIYYHLRKGVSLGEFTIKIVKQEQGDFSWGPTAQKTYYSLGPQAKPQILAVVKEFFDKKPA